MPQSPTPQNSANPLARLNGIKSQMDGCNPTVFHAENVPQAPEDPLFGLMAAYRKDDFDNKVDLGIGAYRDDNAKPWVLPVVKKVPVAHKVEIRASLHADYCPNRRTNCYAKIQTSITNIYL